jgi:hypothetical protein
MSMTNERRAQIAQRLAELENPETGRLTPEAVVADAKRKDSPLHDLFEWDVKKAAYQHWLDRAREVMTMRVVVTTESATVRVVGYVRDPTAGPKDAGYVSIGRLRGDQDGAREVLVAEFGRIRDLLNRARELAAAFDMQDELGSMVTQVVGLRDRVMNMPEQRM